jgi:hypothetical protein
MITFLHLYTAASWVNHYAQGPCSVIAHGDQYTTEPGDQWSNPGWAMIRQYKWDFVMRGR